MSQQRLGQGPLRTDPQPTGPGPAPGPVPDPDGTPGGRAGRFVGWLGRFSSLAAGYVVFQSLVGVLPDDLSGDTARYAVAGSCGVGTAVAVWLAASLLRARAAERAPRDGAPQVAVPGAFPEVAAAAYTHLAAQLARLDDPDRGPLTGWPHALDEQPFPVRPTALGTAYGLHIVLDLGVPDGRIRAGELVQTLWRLRLADGGWAARSQGTVPRPEITALVLGALARAGADPEQLRAEAALCESRFTPEREPAGLELTHVVTTVLRGLLRAAPESAALPRLRDSLVEGAITDPLRQHRRCWGARFTPLQGRRVVPSPVHTAQAVVALDRAARVLGEEDRDARAARAAREDGIRWLLSCPGPLHDGCPDLANSHESVRRPHPQDAARHEVLSVRHFTPAWVLRALLTPGARQLAADEGLDGQWRELVTGAAAAVWRRQTDGIWRWDGEGDDLGHPLWMTYQGLSALRCHALWMYQPHR
ncbi:hypothetical protein ACFQVC_01830 [Streptomyces monticola]|uniref:Squalene cyclase C-terminal domain-containing protein n=1 Tax=Streptomyces monticola TaxID=2666263 RepID=A0ABW2JB69_9ACTN